MERARRLRPGHGPQWELRVVAQLGRWDMVAAMPEQREFVRIGRHLEVDLLFGGVPIAGRSRDLSLNGLFFEPAGAPVVLAPGAEVEVRIFVDGRAGTHTARAAGHVVRADTGGLAVQVDRLIELDSYEILRNLIQYNAADPEQAEREFAAHLGLKALRR